MTESMSTVGYPLGLRGDQWYGLLTQKTDLLVQVSRTLYVINNHLKMLWTFTDMSLGFFNKRVEIFSDELNIEIELQINTERAASAYICDLLDIL